MAGGRPSDYNHEIALEICLEVATSTKSLNTICEANPDFPSEKTVFRWLFKHEEFRQLYAHARENKVWVMADEILEISDDGRNDYMEELDARDPEGKKTKGWRENGEAVQRSKLRSDNRKWLLSKLAPKVFGDAMTLKGDKENPLFANLAQQLDERLSRIRPDQIPGRVIEQAAIISDALPQIVDARKDLDEVED